MASYTLYPPIVNGAEPAFIAGENSYCRVYFSLSKFNGSKDFKNVQVSITKQLTGEKVVNPIDGEVTDDKGNKVKVYRATGIILDMPFVTESVDDNKYYVDIDTSNLNTSKGSYNGWVPGVTYKIQLRLSEKSYFDNNPDDYGQATWINAYASYFSEWSTICVVKPTCEPKIQLLTIKDGIINGSEIIGTYTNEDKTEPLYNYQFTLFDKNDKVLDKSDWIIANQILDQSSIRHTFKYELAYNTNYNVKLEYNTLNNYHDVILYPCKTEENNVKISNVELITLETDYDLNTYSTGTVAENSILSQFTSIFDEEEEGRIAYMLNGTDTAAADMSDIYYVRRTDSTSNFTIWTDIKKIINPSLKFDKEIYYDYTAKDGIFYKYGIQRVANDGTRGPIRIARVAINDYVKKEFTEDFRPSVRDYQHAYLVGRDEQQLKLKFDNNISSFKLNVVDSNSNTIGGVYPITRRVGNTKYKSFGVSGLISFNMDENYLFIPKVDIYNGYDEIQELYKDREIEKGKYNQMYEREFREKVFQFLEDGKVKLFKSPSEGNLLVKLSDISCTPNQTLSRLIYNFSATVTEVADFTVENCMKYHITNLVEPSNRTNVILQEYMHKHSHE